MTKKEARKKYRHLRNELSQEFKSSTSASICSQLTDFNWQGKTVHVFLPIKRLNEIELEAFIQFCYSEKHTVCTSISDFSSNSMKTVIIHSGSEFETNEWGIPEPTNGAELDPREIDVVLVPLLYADSNGNRIGYGKGFYDRFLMTCRPDIQKIGVNYFPPEEMLTDVEATDVKIDLLLIGE